MSRYFSFLVLLAAIVLLVILLYRVMASFMVPIFLAAILVVIFRPTYDWILEKVKGRAQIAAGLTTGGILLAVLIPITLLVLLGVYEGREVVRKLSAGSIVQKIDQARKSMGVDIPAHEERERVQQNLDELVAREFDPGVPFKQQHFATFENSIEGLAKKLDMPSLTELEDQEASLSKEVQSWKELVAAVRDVRSSIDNFGELDNKEEQDEVKAELAAKLETFPKLFSDFQSSSIGGGMWGRIKRMANPSRDELHNYESTLRTFAQDKLVKIGGATTAFIGRLLLGLGIMTVSVYFFLLDGQRMLATLKGLSPLDDQHEDELIQEFSRVSRAVVIATLLSAIAQGFLAGIGFYFVGMESVFLLTLLTACLALVPFAGAAAVWVPVCFWLYFVDGNLWGALGLAVYGVVIVSMADNFIKPYVLHGQSNLHPLLALLSVLGGVTALGPIGILVGPMVVVFLQTLLNILRRELSSMESTSSVKHNEHHQNEVSRWNSMTQS